MIVPACVFINFVINRIKIKKLIVSFFSLKEGALLEVRKKI
jgi:hypothetical protein